MFVRSPSEFYLKYLITHPDRWSDRKIVEHMKAHRLPHGPDSYLAYLRGELHPPRPFFPHREKHEASREFLLEEQIWGLWHPNEHVDMALSILKMPAAQEAAHSMITVGADTKSVALLLDKRYQIPLTEQAVERYKKYFWNTDLVSAGELRDICCDVAATKSKMHPLVLAAELPATPMSAANIQMRLGFMPAGINQYEALKKVDEACTLKMYEALALGGRGSSTMFRDLAWGKKLIAELVEAMTVPEEDVRKALSKIELVTKPLQTPTINELSGGDFSDGTFVQDSEEKAKTKKRKK